MNNEPGESSPAPYRWLLPGALALACVVSLAIFAWSFGPGYLAYWNYAPQAGDILFQPMPRSPLVNAIEGATHSRISHCGVVARRDGEWVVIEALRGVEITPLRDFLMRGRSQAFAIYRLKAEHQQHIPAMLAKAESFLGRPYDSRYELDDEKIYCSELIYKAYLAASGERLGKLVRLGDLDWRPYQATIERYEGGPVPVDREMITPKDLAAAEQLERVTQFGYE